MTGNVTYGAGVPGDDELHLLGDVSGGRRVIELGIAGNAIALAEAGAKAIALDPDPDRIADLRGAAASAGGDRRVPPGRAGRPRLRAERDDRRRAVASHTLDGETGPRPHDAPGPPRAQARRAVRAGDGPPVRRGVGADAALRRRPPHGRRSAHRARPGELPHRGVPRARRRRRPPGARRRSSSRPASKAPDDAARRAGVTVRAAGACASALVERGEVRRRRRPGPAPARCRRRRPGARRPSRSTAPVPRAVAPHLVRARADGRATNGRRPSLVQSANA